MKPILLFTALLLMGLGAGACQATSAACDENGNCNKYVGELQVNDARFEFPASQPITRGQNFWMRAGNSINAAWSSYTIFAGVSGVPCNSTSPINSSCERCDLLNPMLSPLCPTSTGFNGDDFLKISTFPGFSLKSPENVLERIKDPATVRQAVFTFQPAANALAQISTKVGGLGELAQSKLFVLDGGMSQQVTYPLMRFSDGTPDAVFYYGFLDRSPVIEDNFSSDLSIEKIRVIEGTAATDPVTGKFAIKDGCVSAGCPKPSRIFFIPNFSPLVGWPNGQNNCYADMSPQSPPDGDFDNVRCPMFDDATPAYLKTSPMDRLAWIAEFRTGDGAILPSESPDVTLGIEFSVK